MTRLILIAVVASLLAFSCGAPQAQPETPTTSVTSGPLEFVVHLKYELFLSWHVLATADEEDFHHEVLRDWATDLRATLLPETVADIEDLLAHVHESHFATAVAGYSGPSSIEGLIGWLSTASDDLLENPARWYEMELAEFRGHLVDLIQRFWDEGFGETWNSEHLPLLVADIGHAAEALDGLAESPADSIERLTGRSVPGEGIAFYSSSFSRPNHGYMFEEPERLAVVYQADAVVEQLQSTALHELLHPTLRDGGTPWHELSGVPEALDRLTGAPLFADDAAALASSYGTPWAVVDELLTATLANYFFTEVTEHTEEDVLGWGYASSTLQGALYEAAFRCYFAYGDVDRFIPFALQAIEVAGDAYVFDDPSCGGAFPL